MANGVLLHRSDSIYDDVPSERYQFPRQYLSRVEACVDDWIIYLEPSKVTDTRGYFAMAMIDRVMPDPDAPGMHVAMIVPGSYLDFGQPVPFRGPEGIVERSVLNEHGNISGRAQAAVRTIPPEDFRRIVDLGLAGGDDLLAREDPVWQDDGPRYEMDDPAVPFEFDAGPRQQELVPRAVRDRNFRRIVLGAYDERCAMTGLRLINGGGRAEVEAAHIKPVERGGPDIVSNGLALCGTAHWMFDRGLIGVGEDREILISRQVNDRPSVEALLNSDRLLRVPARPAHQPYPGFLRWHREECFKR